MICRIVMVRGVVSCSRGDANQRCWPAITGCALVQGLATIRAFREQPAFIAVGRRLIDQSTRCLWPKLVGFMTLRWT